MYCKKCNINVKKNKKVCPKCGLALVPGEAKIEKASRLRRIVIIASAVAAVVIATFLCIFLIGRVPTKLYGTWYEPNGYGYLEFGPNGVLTMTSVGDANEGIYTFNSATEEGTIVLEDRESTFTCDGTTLDWGGSIMTKAYVKQIEYDWSSALEGMLE